MRDRAVEDSKQPDDERGAMPEAPRVAQVLRAGLSPSTVLSLQRAAGNRAVAELVTRAPVRSVQRQNDDDDDYDDDDQPRRGRRGTRDREGRDRSRGSRPRDAPRGTVPIDQSGLTREQIHKIKQRIGAGAADWVGITPDGHVVTTDADGNTIDHGRAEDLLAREQTPAIDDTTRNRARSAAKGALIGAGIGTVLGGIGGAILGAGGGTLVAPGVGTVGGGVAGAVAGAEAGAFVGTAAGAAIGGVIGWFTGG